MDTETKEQFTEESMEAALIDPLLTQANEGQELYDPRSDGAEACIESVNSFEEAGLMTYDRGFVLRMTDGTEFQVTVKQSR
jgi:hypothetical protein